jgi:hypothetical protein
MTSSIQRSRGKAAYRRAAAASVLKPVNSALPAISGTEQVGETLTATNGTWTNTPTYARQWLRDGVPIDGETGTTYDLVAEDEGALISLRVTAENDGFRAIPVVSDPTGEIVAAA